VAKVQKEFVARKTQKTSSQLETRMGNHRGDLSIHVFVGGGQAL